MVDTTMIDIDDGNKYILQELSNSHMLFMAEW
jgi:hypothetical protein